MIAPKRFYLDERLFRRPIYRYGDADRFWISALTCLADPPGCVILHGWLHSDDRARWKQPHHFTVRGRDPPHEADSIIAHRARRLVRSTGGMRPTSPRSRDIRRHFPSTARSR